MSSTLIYTYYWATVYLSDENSYQQPSRLSRNRLSGTMGSHPSSNISSPSDAAKLVASSLLGVQRLTLMTYYAKVSLPGQNLIPPSAAHAVIAVFHPRSGRMSGFGYVYSSL